MEFGLISKKDEYVGFILLTCMLGSSSGQGSADVVDGFTANRSVVVFFPVIGIVIVIVIVIVRIGIISCFICCFCACTRSGTRQRSGAVAMRLYHMNRVPAAIPSGVTRQIIGDPNPPASSLVMSSPRTMYAPSSAQITPAYPQQNYPQQPYATQPAVFTYPLQPALSTSANARYPTQSSSASSYPPQPAIAPHQPHHPAPKPDVHPHQLTGKKLYPQQGYHPQGSENEQV